MSARSIITSSGNAQVKNLIQLQKKAKAREEQGIFIVEGLKMFEEARDAGLLVKAYVSESFYQEMVLKAPDYFLSMNYEILSDTLFREVAETMTPQGILGTVRKTEYSLESILKAPNACL
jgi:TrmH family RNA methyltransferase